LAERLAASDRDIVISAEDLSLGMDPADVRRLLDYLARFFGEVRVIAYLRDAPTYAISAFQEMQKVRQVAFSLPDLLPDYRRRFAAWEDVLGPGAVTYVPFAQGALRGGDVVTDFATRLGLAGVAAQGRANRAMSAEAVAVIYVLWRLPFVDAGRRAALVGDWVARLAGFGTRRLCLTEAAAAEVRRLAADDLRWMETRPGVALGPPAPEPRQKVARIGSAAGLWWLALRSALPLAAWLMRGRWRDG
jgi:hypothetical protein